MPRALKGKAHWRGSDYLCTSQLQLFMLDLMVACDLKSLTMGRCKLSLGLEWRYVSLYSSKLSERQIKVIMGNFPGKEHNIYLLLTTDSNVSSMLMTSLISQSFLVTPAAMAGLVRSVL